MTELDKQRPLGLSLPIELGESGYFNQNYDTFSQARTNIINLLQTRPGERRMSPTFGCRLHNMIFEPNTEILPDIIENIIKEDISNWVNDVDVTDVSVYVLKNDKSISALDIYRLDIKVEFRILFTGESGIISVSMNKGSI